MRTASAAVALTACVVAAVLMPRDVAAGVALERVGDYSEPIYVTSDPGNENRLFVVERAGRLELTTAGLTTTFLDQRAITSSGGERGLLSMAFDPDLTETRRFYVLYTDAPDQSIRVDELHAAGDVADPASRRHVLTIPHPGSWHYAGQLQFGPDGYLYISVGDGGGDGGPAQDPATLLGALLRIDPRRSGPDPYTVPAENPLVGTGGAEEIWSLGLRNPWRFSFDRETGALTIADVGQSRREEINHRPQDVGGGRGDNFGWNCREGSVPNPSAPPECDDAGPFIDPVFDHPITHDPDCAIIGGYVVRDRSLADLYGRYLYSDLCGGDLRSIVLDVPAARDSRSEGLRRSRPWSFGEDACGRIYVVSGRGTVSRLVAESGDRDPGACPPGSPPRILPPLGLAR